MDMTTQDLIEALRSSLAPADETATPLYRQLQRGIRRALDHGLLLVGDALPSERDLADLLRVSRVTVRKSIGGLVAEGLLTQQQGAGTFVAPRVEQPLAVLTSFSEDMAARGMSPGGVWLDQGTGLASPEEALALGLAPSAPVSRLYRLRSANHKPMTLERTTVPRVYLPDPWSVGDSLYAHLRAAGFPPFRALQRLRAERLEADAAKLLAAPVGSPAIYIERRAFLRAGEPVEFSRSLYRGDAYDFVVELRLDEHDRDNGASA